MADKPILFSGPMVRAILDGRKTQTRRIIKNAPDVPHMDKVGPTGFQFTGEGGLPRIPFSPPYAIGDRLWVRETFALSGIGWGKKPSEAYGGKVHFCADPDHGWNDYWGNWHPSIHMPRWASRLTLIVEDVRVQRLQEISVLDALAEGIEEVSSQFPADEGDDGASYPSFRAYGQDAYYSGYLAERLSFMTLWNSINGAGAWGANPWVAAVTFRTVHANIDALDKAA